MLLEPLIIIKKTFWLEIIIDLKETSLESLEMDYQTTDVSETGWFDYAIKDNKFQAAGDPSINDLSKLVREKSNSASLEFNNDDRFWLFHILFEKNKCY